MSSRRFQREGVGTGRPAMSRPDMSEIPTKVRVKVAPIF